MSEQEVTDKWIAEHVMGWQWWRFELKGRMGKWCQLIPPEEKWPIKKTAWNGVLCKCKIDGWEDCTDLSLFKPTTNPAAAMQVLEKCAKKWVGSVRIKALESTEYFIVSCYHGGSNVAAFQGEGTTLPLAICLFAKKLFSA